MQTQGHNSFETDPYRKLIHGHKRAEPGAQWRKRQAWSGASEWRRTTGDTLGCSPCALLPSTEISLYYRLLILCTDVKQERQSMGRELCQGLYNKESRLPSLLLQLSGCFSNAGRAPAVRADLLPRDSGEKNLLLSCYLETGEVSGPKSLSASSLTRNILLFQVYQGYKVWRCVVFFVLLHFPPQTSLLNTCLPYYLNPYLIY